VVTANSRAKVELKATPNEIASKVLEVRAELAVAVVESEGASGGVVCDGGGAVCAPS